MSKVCTTVSLDSNEVFDALIEKARLVAKTQGNDKTIGGAKAEVFTGPDNTEKVTVASATITFSWGK